MSLKDEMMKRAQKVEAGRSINGDSGTSRRESLKWVRKVPYNFLLASPRLPTLVAITAQQTAKPKQAFLSITTP
jgi:hypothetical protein